MYSWIVCLFLTSANDHLLCKFLNISFSNSFPTVNPNGCLANTSDQQAEQTHFFLYCFHLLSPTLLKRTVHWFYTFVSSLVLLSLKTQLHNIIIGFRGRFQDNVAQLGPRDSKLIQQRQDYKLRDWSFEKCGNLSGMVGLTILCLKSQFESSGY